MNTKKSQKTRKKENESSSRHERTHNKRKKRKADMSHDNGASSYPTNDTLRQRTPYTFPGDDAPVAIPMYLINRIDEKKKNHFYVALTEQLSVREVANSRYDHIPKCFGRIDLSGGPKAVTLGRPNQYVLPASVCHLGMDSVIHGWTGFLWVPNISAISPKCLDRELVPMRYCGPTTQTASNVGGHAIGNRVAATTVDPFLPRWTSFQDDPTQGVMMGDLVLLSTTVRHGRQPLAQLLASIDEDRRIYHVEMEMKKAKFLQQSGPDDLSVVGSSEADGMRQQQRHHENTLDSAAASGRMVMIPSAAVAIVHHALARVQQQSAATARMIAPKTDKGTNAGTSAKQRYWVIDRLLYTSQTKEEFGQLLALAIAKDMMKQMKNCGSSSTNSEGVGTTAGQELLDAKDITNNSSCSYLASFRNKNDLYERLLDPICDTVLTSLLSKHRERLNVVAQIQEGSAHLRSGPSVLSKTQELPATTLNFPFLSAPLDECRATMRTAMIPVIDAMVHPSTTIRNGYADGKEEEESKANNNRAAGGGDTPSSSSFDASDDASPFTPFAFVQSALQSSAVAKRPFPTIFWAHSDLTVSALHLDPKNNTIIEEQQKKRKDWSNTLPHLLLRHQQCVGAVWRQSFSDPTSLLFQVGDGKSDAAVVRLATDRNELVCVRPTTATMTNADIAAASTSRSCVGGEAIERPASRPTEVVPLFHRARFVGFMRGSMVRFLLRP